VFWLIGIGFNSGTPQKPRQNRYPRVGLWQTCHRSNCKHKAPARRLTPAATYSPSAWCEELPILHPHAAGIDVGASELFVAVGADRDPQPVCSFPTFTRDLNALGDWLQRCGIRSVAMESTSVYWIPVYQMLESRGLEVCLVNAQHVKNEAPSVPI